MSLEAYLGFCETYMMEIFVKVVKGFQSLTALTKQLPFRCLTRSRIVLCLSSQMDAANLYFELLAVYNLKTFKKIIWDQVLYLGKNVMANYPVNFVEDILHHRYSLICYRLIPTDHT